MNTKTERYSRLRPLAVSLRKQGKTFSEIQDEIGYIPKGTLSGWLKNITLTDKQLTRINQIKRVAGHAGRQKGAWANRQKRVERLQNLRRIAELEYPTLIKDPLFLAGLLLYLAEGTKKSEGFMFMNSDAGLIKFMIQWIELAGSIPKQDLKFRLYIHELYKHENCELYWRTELKVSKSQFQKTIYKPTERIYKKNPIYKGCLRIEVRGSELYWKTMFWRDCFYKTISS